MAHVKEFEQQEWKIFVDVGQQDTKYIKSCMVMKIIRNIYTNEWMQQHDDYITTILAKRYLTLVILQKFQQGYYLHKISFTLEHIWCDST